MKHAHEVYLEGRLAIIDLEIEEAQRQAIVSIGHVAEMKRRRLHVASELDIFRDRRERSELAHTQTGALRWDRQGLLQSAPRVELS